MALEKLLNLAVDFAKDNGVGVSIPIAIWVVARVVIEDYKDKKEAGEKNHDAIHILEIQVAKLEEALAIIKRDLY